MLGKARSENDRIDRKFNRRLHGRTITEHLVKDGDSGSFSSVIVTLLRSIQWPIRQEVSR